MHLLEPAGRAHAFPGASILMVQVGGKTRRALEHTCIAFTYILHTHACVTHPACRRARAYGPLLLRTPPPSRPCDLRACVGAVSGGMHSQMQCVGAWCVILPNVVAKRANPRGANPQCTWTGGVLQKMGCGVIFMVGWVSLTLGLVQIREAI